MTPPFPSEEYLGSNIAVQGRGRPPKLLVFSGSGHWVRLLRVTDTLRDCDVIFVTTQAAYRSQVGDHKFDAVSSTRRSNKLALIRTAQQLGRELPAAASHQLHTNQQSARTVS
jgi:hypothetical protein